jgi:hypothetical protein
MSLLHKRSKRSRGETRGTSKPESGPKAAVHKWLSQYLDDLPCALGQLVQQEDPVVDQRHLPRPRHRPTADRAHVADGMRRGATRPRRHRRGAAIGGAGHMGVRTTLVTTRPYRVPHHISRADVAVPLLRTSVCRRAHRRSGLHTLSSFRHSTQWASAGVEALPLGG